VIPISASTWAVIAQDNNGDNGIWRTTTAGRSGGAISTSAWAKVDSLEHAHGSHQNVVLEDGTIFVTGNTNGAVSTDHGATWTPFTESSSWSPPHQFESSQMTNLAVTDRYVYTNFMANTVMARAPIDRVVGAAQWDIAYCDKPAGLSVGRRMPDSSIALPLANAAWLTEDACLSGPINSAPVSTDQILTVPSVAAVTNRLLSGLNRTESTSAEFRSGNMFVAQLRVSQTNAAWSKPAVAMSRPSGLKSNALRPPPCGRCR
jgi:hypothetical protein